MPYSVKTDNNNGYIFFKAYDSFTMADSITMLSLWKEIIDRTTLKKTLVDLTDVIMTKDFVRRLMELDLSVECYFLMGVKVAVVSNQQLKEHLKFESNARERGFYFRLFTKLQNAKDWLNS